MGTNYYAEHSLCDCCKRGRDPIHIGKSSGGWTFSFHAVQTHELWSWDEACHEEIDSWEKWQQLLSRPGVVIRDEYDRLHTLDEFRDLVMSKIDGVRHFDYLVEHHYSCTNDFLDAAGHSFSRGDFS